MEWINVEGNSESRSASEGPATHSFYYTGLTDTQNYQYSSPHQLSEQTASTYYPYPSSNNYYSEAEVNPNHVTWQHYDNPEYSNYPHSTSTQQYPSDFYYCNCCQAPVSCNAVCSCKMNQECSNSTTESSFNAEKNRDSPDPQDTKVTKVTRNGSRITLRIPKAVQALTMKSHLGRKRQNHNKTPVTNEEKSKLRRRCGMQNYREQDWKLKKAMEMCIDTMFRKLNQQQRDELEVKDPDIFVFTQNVVEKYNNDKL